MSMISLRLDDEDEKLIKEYAQANNISLSALFRDAVLEKIEDEVDLALYKKAMAEHKQAPDTVSFDEMMEELNSDEEV
ncbi:type II toxin-antitoxin system RelB family antitoxin [Jeotgalibacillus malaysiensis]|uniref:type II toxin-antitoxin system RelB family antitoxin n=1 Tax=Jeotgalibacillus malaysiensis TaxID=1508404 RepID=UPI0038508936